MLTSREAGWLMLGARLKPGASRAQASAEMAAIGAALGTRVSRGVRSGGAPPGGYTWSAQIASPIPYGLRHPHRSIPRAVDGPRQCRSGHRLRQCRRRAAGARDHAAPRDRHPCRQRGGAEPADSPVADGNNPAVSPRRSRGIVAGARDDVVARLAAAGVSGAARRVRAARLAGGRVLAAPDAGGVVARGTRSRASCLPVRRRDGAQGRRGRGIRAALAPTRLRRGAGGVQHPSRRHRRHARARARGDEERGPGVRRAGRRRGDDRSVDRWLYRRDRCTVHPRSDGARAQPAGRAGRNDCRSRAGQAEV